MFFSPTCSHCHQVLDQTLPPLMQKYGDQLELVLVNISTGKGSQLYYAAANQYQISESNWGVPALLIGPTYLVGSHEIASKLPTLIEEGIASGGVALPHLPGLVQDLEAVASTPYVDRDVFVLDHSSDLETLPRMGVAEKLAKDPLGSALAICLLIAMVGSLIFLPFRWAESGLSPKMGLKSFGWIFPILASAGLIIAVYLTYLEMTGHAALCGPIGNCDEVQQSSYAWLFGVIPVGLVGVLGYVVLGLAWSLRQFHRSSIGFIALPCFTYFAVVFSAYLTFLEPFVIGAICTWCLVSALITLVLLWLSAPATQRKGFNAKTQRR
ncbi:MAG: vitamin K epoxide reductase [Verrucomicrobia bacterium]|nr:vitamin K epoxide reductase [Verrucomicrobiota bacterium]